MCGKHGNRGPYKPPEACKGFHSKHHGRRCKGKEHERNHLPCALVRNHGTHLAAKDHKRAGDNAPGHRRGDLQDREDAAEPR